MLYIMRHGKTDWNALKKLQGKTDVPLNGEGRAMTETAAQKFSDIRFDVCFCSPLKRAVETARIFLKNKNVPVVLDDRLTEMGFGVYEGLKNSDISPGCPVITLFDNPEKYVPDGGAESLGSLFARTRDFLLNAAKPLLDGGKNVLIVGHGAMNSSIICQIKGIPLENFWSALTDNCELVRLL